jgi:3-keto-5-aminohexanoate cleavage enzyme
MTKVIVCVAPTSNFHGKEANPAIPYTPQEVADEVYRAWSEGASIVHLHARDENGIPTNQARYYQELDRLIREKNCDIIIQHSMAPANTPALLSKGGLADIDEGTMASMTTPRPEMVSLEVGPAMPLIPNAKPFLIGWNRLWAENVAKGLTEKGIKPEIEIGSNSLLEALEYMIEKGVLAKPYYVNFTMNFHRRIEGGVKYTPKHLMQMVDLLPPDSMFSVLGVGYPTQFEATTQSLLLGGNIRVGFEDNIYLENNRVLAKSNGELVAKAVGIAKALGREIASPAEARQMLGIAQLT